MKTSELSGAMLDYWVAEALGLNPIMRERQCYVPAREEETHPGELILWEPATCWSLQGGQIIEREGLSIEPNFYADEFERNEICDWTCVHVRKGEVQRGPTPLIAAMRAFVASRIDGDEVPEIDISQNFP